MAPSSRPPLPTGKNVVVLKKTPADLPPAPPPPTVPQRVTLADVAARAGVSRATASLVLRESPLVAAATRARVLEAGKALGYVYHRAAANLRGRRTMAIGLLVCEITNPFYSEFTAAIDEFLDTEGYVAFLANTLESFDRQTRFLQRMREQGVDGVIFCPAVGTPAGVLHELRAWGLPAVQALRHASPSFGDYVGVDYELGVVQAAEHLIRLGHRRIAFVGGERAYSAAAERHAGFTATLRRHGLTPDLMVKTPLSRRAGSDAVAALLERADPPTAAICFNDVVAFGMMAGLQRRGLWPGRDFAVIGMDDVPEAAVAHPALTTVATSARQIGQEAARLLLRRIAAPAGASERIILPPRLIVRESCGASDTGAPGARVLPFDRVPA